MNKTEFLDLEGLNESGIMEFSKKIADMEKVAGHLKIQEKDVTAEHELNRSDSTRLFKPMKCTQSVLN